MCCGDVALEGAETTFPIGAKGGSDGWDATHVCKNYQQVHDYLEEHRRDDNEWIWKASVFSVYLLSKNILT